MGARRVVNTFWRENMTEGVNFEDPCVKGMIILKLISKKHFWDWPGVNWLRIRTSGGLF